MDSRWIRLSFSLAVLFTAPAVASPHLSTVCDTGCTYTNLQDAIDAVTISPWTIQLMPGVHTSDDPVVIDGKSDLTIVGYGEGASVLRASPTWFENAVGSDALAKFVRIVDSHHVTIRDLTIDASTNAPDDLVRSQTTGGLTGVLVDGSGPVRFEDCGVSAFQTGITDVHLASTERIELFSVRVVSQFYGIWAASGTWLVWSSDIRAEGHATASPAPDYAIGLYLTAGYRNFNAWASHFHGESDGSGPYLVTVAGAAQDTVSSTDRATFVGCTLHGKLTAIPGSGPQSVVGMRVQGGVNRVDVVGSDLVYEAPATLTSGTVAGLLAGSGPSQPNVYLVGSTILDRARDDSTNPPTLAGAIHKDLLRAGNPAQTMDNVQTVGTLATSAGNGTNAGGPGMPTLERQTGTATFASSATASVTLALPLPSSKYQVSVTANANETVWVSAKTTTGFTLNSSNGTSTATVDWVVSY